MRLGWKSCFVAMVVIPMACTGGPEPQASSTGADTETDTDEPTSSTDGPATADGSSSGQPPLSCDEQELSEMYVRYVEPFVSGAVPSSCSQCHMTGIDLTLYAQDTPCQTMACMVDAGVVDLQQPPQSSLLAQIMMGDPNSSVFDVQQEHDAMLEWIEWSAQCHGEVCGEIESACGAGTGASSTGVDPIGDCSEEDLLAVFWDSVIIDRQRCISCHTDYGAQQATFGECAVTTDCEGNQECLDGLCRLPGPYLAPHVFEGADVAFEWGNLDHRQMGLNTMYNMVALDWFDTTEPLDGKAMVKPLLEGFQPTAVYGPGVSIEAVASGTGVGVYHGGSNKFAFGCEAGGACPTEGVVDCRVEQPCGAGCGAGMECLEGYCRVAGSFCDATYVAYVRFAQYFAECKGS